jgi:hypothetical protein
MGFFPPLAKFFLLVALAAAQFSAFVIPDDRANSTQGKAAKV